MKKLYVGLLFVVSAFVIFKERGLYPLLHQKPTSSERTVVSKVSISSSRGEQKKVSLPDGTQVCLNAASVLSYPVNIKTGERAVELYGEAFFDVSPSIDHPFFVRAKDMRIQVLGTRFNVRSYPDEITSSAVVTLGSIKVSYSDSVKILKAGDHVDVDPEDLNGHALTISSNTDTAALTGWQNGWVRYHQVDLRGLLRELSRAYDVDVELDGKISDHRYSGVLKKSEPIEQVIKVLVSPYEHFTMSNPGKQRLVIAVN